MDFDLAQAAPVLARTPAALRALLAGLPGECTAGNEGAGTWSPVEVIGHLVHGERTDWMPRARMILEHGEGRSFDPFDRFAMLREGQGRSLEALLDDLQALRAANLEALAALRLGPADLARRGRHPDFGPVTLAELLATWVAHDLGHLAQVARVMAKQYSTAVGPWRVYLPVLGDRRG